MRAKTRIFFAFLLNLVFSAVELVGGLMTGSVAILSDALHDAGDAAGIGLSFFLEAFSGKRADRRYTYGYLRFSVLGGLLTSLLLMGGATVVIWRAALRLASPVPINYNGVIWLSVVGIVINLAATLLTAGGHSLNQRAVSLHMLEDVLGWVAVLAGAIVMRFTDWVFLDPLLSIALSIVLLVFSAKTAIEALSILLDRAPSTVSAAELRAALEGIEGVREVHHLHVRSLDGSRHEACLHLVAEGDGIEIRAAARARLREHGVDCATIELEAVGEHCTCRECTLSLPQKPGGHHHHHHGHHHH